MGDHGNRTAAAGTCVIMLVIFFDASQHSMISLLSRRLECSSTMVRGDGGGQPHKIAGLVCSHTTFELPARLACSDLCVGDCRRWIKARYILVILGTHGIMEFTQ